MSLKCLLGVSLLSLVTLTPICNAKNVEQISSETKNTCFKAALNEEISNPSDDIYKLKDLSGNTFYAQTGEESGFMVFDPIVNNFIEKSSELISPYDFTEFS